MTVLLRQQALTTPYTSSTALMQPSFSGLFVTCNRQPDKPTTHRASALATLCLLSQGALGYQHHAFKGRAPTPHGAHMLVRFLSTQQSYPADIRVCSSNIILWCNSACVLNTAPKASRSPAHLCVLAPHDLAGWCDQTQLADVDLDDCTCSRGWDTYSHNGRQEGSSVLVT